MKVMLLGAPGAGKGTVAKLLTALDGSVQISTGDILRAEVRAGSDLGKQAEAFMKAGDLVPDSLIMDMMEKRFQQDDCKKGFLLDGFPRTVAQAEALDTMLGERGRKLAAVVEIAVPEDRLVKRLTGRFTCARCGEGYNDFFKRPKVEGICDRCGSSEFTRRKDDSPETVNQRLAAYRELTRPLLPYYEERGLLHRVDGAQPIDTVTQEVDRAIGVKGQVPPDCA